jgi:hypothetical protein
MKAIKVGRAFKSRGGNAFTKPFEKYKGCISLFSRRNPRNKK